MTIKEAFIILTREPHHNGKSGFVFYFEMPIYKNVNTGTFNVINSSNNSQIFTGTYTLVKEENEPLKIRVFSVCGNRKLIFPLNKNEKEIARKIEIMGDYYLFPIDTFLHFLNVGKFSFVEAKSRK